MAYQSDVTHTLIPFDNSDFGEIRGLLIDGEPHFVGKDIATALGFKDTKNALKQHVDEEDKKGWRITTPSRGTQKMVVINESGLYSLIFGSKLDTAKKFKRWVTSEVLPAIRKTGSYSLPQTQLERDPRWIETRRLGKKTRKLLTQAIQALEEYFNARGTFFPAGYIYGHLTNVIQNALGIEKGSRDSLTVKKLNQLDQAEDIAGGTIFTNIASGYIRSLAEIDALILSQLRQLNSLLSGQLFLPAYL